MSYHALIKLGFAESDFVLQNDSDGNGTYIAKWNSDQPQPTEAEIETAHAEWQADHDSKAYARARADAYAPIADQMDMQYHDSVNGSRTWLDHIEAVKEAHPK